MNQRFKVTFTVDTECEEVLDEKGVKEWTEEQFKDCDLGSVEVVSVEERYRPGLKPAGEAKDVHTEHCCTIHGCKYSNDDCTVTNRKLVQSHSCETCGLEDSGYFDQ